MYEQIKTKENYDLLKKSGFMGEFHPELTFNWDIDKHLIFGGSELPMKVFKFYCGELYYAFAAKTKELAIDAFIRETGDQFTMCDEILEIEWDKKIISVWEDNDFTKKPYKESIRGVMCGTEPQLIFTNDTASF